MTTTDITLAPCPFCGGGETQIHLNKGTWTGMGYGEPVSVEVRHWCAQEAGQPSRMISRAGRDEASAIAAWNRRAQAAPQGPALVPLTDEQCDAVAYALDSWARDISRYDYGLPMQPELWREIIRASIHESHGITGAPNGKPT